MVNRKLKFNKYGWRRDRLDRRDIKYSVPQTLSAASFPKKHNLLPYCPSVYQQDELGSCTGQAIGAHLHINGIKKNPATAFQPSALFIYYNERVLENTVGEDAGAELRSGIKSLVRWGVCAEQYHPYIISKFKSKPTALAYTNAIPNRISQYMRLNRDLTHFKSRLLEGFPIVFGMSAYSSFESDQVEKTGILPMPGRFERQIGGHCCLLVGWDDNEDRVLIRNSYGAEWGMDGYFTMPYDYIMDNDLTDDFWTITS